MILKQTWNWKLAYKLIGLTDLKKIEALHPKYQKKQK